MADGFMWNGELYLPAEKVLEYLRNCNAVPGATIKHCIDALEMELAAVKVDALEEEFDD